MRLDQAKVMVVGLLFFLGFLPFPGNAEAQEHPSVASESAIEERLLAPCCWVQTLDIHESPLATELRGEIRQRLAAGETPQAIEDALAARYGERIRAVPRGKDPLSRIPLGVGLAVLLSGVGLVAVLRQWVRQGKRATAAAASPGVEDPGEEARLDEELARLDE